MAGVAGKHPQTAYVGLQKYLQQEWDFVQRVTQDIGTAVHPMEDDLRDAFLPHLFKGATLQTPGRAVTGLPVKQAGIALPDPTQNPRANWKVSCVITVHLVSALCGTAVF